MVIWKYRVLVVGTFNVRMPIGATVISVQVQQGEPVMWAVCNPENKEETRRFHVLATGLTYNSHKLGQFIGTFQLGDENYIGHLFEER